MKLRSRSIFNILTMMALLVMLFGLLPPSPVQANEFGSPLPAGGDFLFANRVGGAGTDRGLSIAVDSSNNIYTTGSFEGTVDFDPGVGVTNLTSVGISGLFISKSDSNGNFLWAKSTGGVGQSIVIDSNGNIYVTGYFSGTVDFNPGVGVSNLTSASADNDVVVLKLDNSGNFVWAKSMGGVSGDVGEEIALDSNGNVYTIGFFAETADFDPGAGTFNLNGAGFLDVFISKLDNSGSFVWAKSIGGTGYDYARGIAIDSSGNVYLTGNFHDTVDFDPGVGVANLTSKGFSDIFISKLDGNGSFVWAKGVGGVGSDSGRSIAIDSSSNVYTTGSFYDTVDFDPSIGVFNLTSVNGDNTFVSKLNSNGDFAWAKGLGKGSGAGIVLDVSGNIYTTGDFIDTADFDPGIGTYNLTGLGFGEIFVSKLDGNGDFEWAKSMGGAGADFGVAIALASNGNIYTTGFFEETADFDPGVGTTNLTSEGNSDIFISKLEEKVPVFNDVLFTYWANSFIERLAAAGVTGGCGVGIYCPDATVTRAQMAVFLLKGMHGSSFTPPTVGVSTGFGDVAIDYWAAAWIKQLAAEGITSGCGGGNYCPDATVTRAQMAIFLLKAKHGSSYSPPNASGVFTDVPVGYWADKWIEQLAVEGVTSGCGNGNYCPDNSVTRAQMAVFLVKAFNLP